MKIGLYIQDYRKQNKREFRKAIKQTKKSTIDLLVFPETCYTPFENVYFNNDFSREKNENNLENKTLKISKLAGCAVIIGGQDKYGTIFSIYGNYYATENETKINKYLKHTMTDESPLGREDYGENISKFFNCCILKGKRIGMTICYDCNHSAFSRAYKHENVDIIVNSTGGNVIYTKWYRYNKVRAIENKCFHFCTMGYCENGKENSYSFGFTPNGKLMEGMPIFKDRDIGNIFVYDTENTDKGFEEDISLKQKETISAKTGFSLKLSEVDTLIKKAKKIEDGIFIHYNVNSSIVICVLNDDEILQPEKVLSKLYNSKLKDIQNKKYLIINKYNQLDKNYFNNILSDVLKVRSMENFCAVLLLSDKMSRCYQCGFNRTAQVISLKNGAYDLDTMRMTGPEAIWKNKKGMQSKWRKGFEKLIEYIENE